MRVQLVGRMVLLGLLLIMAGCDKEGKPAEDFLPKMSEDEYTTIKASGLQTALESLGETGSIVLKDPRLLATVVAVDGLIDCTQNTGSIAVRAYDLKENNLIAGAAVVVNISRLASWETARSCLEEIFNIEGFVDQELKPCASWWHYEEDDADYYMLQAGTGPYICEAMCSGMKGCPDADMVDDLLK